MKLPVDSAMERFEKEWQVIQGRRTERAGMVQRARTEPHWWQRHAGLLVASVAVAIVVSYFAWQIIQFFRPPLLVISNPAGDISTSQEELTLTGQSIAEAIVSVNNEPVEVQADGSFTDQVILQPGLNVLKISSQRKRSRTAVIVRRVVYELPNGEPVPNTNTSVNAATNTALNANINK